MERSDLLAHNYIGVYTDGSSFISKDKKLYEAGSGYIITINDVPVCQAMFYHKGGTNSIGEVYAMHQAIEKVEEIKRDNPELKKWFTFYMSDSQYVIKSLNEYINSWRKQGYDKDWVGSTGKPVAYQKIFKYIQQKYFDDKNWYKTNLFLHIKGHLNEKGDHNKYYGKFIEFNKKQMDYKRKFCYRNTFDTFIVYNGKVDELAGYAREKKIFYKEERLMGEKWDINLKNLPRRNHLPIIRARKGGKE